MLVPAIPQFRGPRRRTARTRPLVLVRASFDHGVVKVVLGFDRAIRIDALAGNQILVDYVSGVQYDATGTATLLDPQTVEIEMFEVQNLPFPDTRLTVTTASGIVAAQDGVVWGGVGGLLLPFPS